MLPFPPSTNTEIHLCGNLSDLPASPGIYMIRDAEKNRIYVGSAAGIKQRAKQHEYRLRKGTHSNKRLQAIWGVDAQRLRISVIELLPNSSPEQRLRVEQFYLDSLDVGSNRNCLNVLKVAGSGVGAKRSIEFCKRMSDLNKGRTFTEETREKMRAAKLGKPLSKEHKEKLSEIRKGKKIKRPTGVINKKVRTLSDDEVRRLRSMRGHGYSWRELSLEFNMHISACRRAALGETYKDVK